MNIHMLLRTRLLAGMVCLMVLAGCAGPQLMAVPAPNGPEAESYLKRADLQAQAQQQVEVKVAVLRDNESQAVFGLPMAEKGIQPVWVEINNRSKFPLWFLPVFLDKDFFSAREVAYLFRGSDDRQNTAVERLVSDRQINLHIPPGGRVAGFVYTNITRGIKLVNVELAGSRRLLRFPFARELPGGGFDFETIDPAQLYPRERITDVPVAKFGTALQKLICCTTDKVGKVMGDPLNLVVVGEEHELLVTMVRGGWDFTETTTANSIGKMIDSMVLGASYRNSPVSPLYFEGRKQDFSMQRARATISQRNHLRLWLTSLRVDGKPVWVGQVSRDIGVRLTTRSPFLTTHKVDPEVDEAREYLLQDMLWSNGISRWGMAGGVGAAAIDQPRENLTGDPYFTDGKRLVLFISATPKSIPEVELVEW